MSNCVGQTLTYMQSSRHFRKIPTKPLAIRPSPTFCQPAFLAQMAVFRPSTPDSQRFWRISAVFMADISGQDPPFNGPEHCQCENAALPATSPMLPWMAPGGGTIAVRDCCNGWQSPRTAERTEGLWLELADEYPSFGQNRCQSSTFAMMCQSLIPCSNLETAVNPRISCGGISPSGTWDAASCQCSRAADQLRAANPWRCAGRSRNIRS
ncbi:hypothetical protein SAMN05216604_115119 [Pseudomonas agarici]|nr:hypothetical protein SAMN05216604_115119 [Pseudomonas agarici]